MLQFDIFPSVLSGHIDSLSYSGTDLFDLNKHFPSVKESSGLWEVASDLRSALKERYADLGLVITVTDLRQRVMVRIADNPCRNLHDSILPDIQADVREFLRSFCLDNSYIPPAVCADVLEDIFICFGDEQDEKDNKSFQHMYMAVRRALVKWMSFEMFFNDHKVTASNGKLFVDNKEISLDELEMKVGA